MMRGRVDGDVLTFATVDDTPPRARMTWDASDPAGLRWSKESCVDGREWCLTEVYHLEPVAGTGFR
jgi:hypothetical protein